MVKQELRKLNQGFTLVEMLISITILAMVMALSFQAFSLYLNTFSRTKSIVSEAESLMVSQFRFRNSISSMRDYYVSHNGDAALLVNYSDGSLEYVSAYSITGYAGDVIVKWYIDTESENDNLMLIECPLSKVLPLELAFEFNNDNCTKSLFIENGQNFNLSYTQHPEVYAYDDVSQNVELVTRRHLLPQSVTLTYSRDDESIEFIALTKARNLVKLLEYTKDVTQVSL